MPAHWDLMPEIVKMRDEISPETLLIGNGDVVSVEQADQYATKYGCDGVMVGRGIFGKPWFFAGKLPKGKTSLDLLLEHTRKFEKAYCGPNRQKSFDVMKKHFKAYVNGWDGAKELRAKLMLAKNYKDVKREIKAANCLGM